MHVVVLLFYNKTCTELVHLFSEILNQLMLSHMKLVSGVNNLQIVYNLLRVIMCKT